MKLRYGAGRFWPLHLAGAILLVIAAYFVFIQYF